MQATYFAANGWLLDLAGLKILVDPWLTGSLCFGGQRWFFEGRLQRDWPVPDADLLLLSQGLEDHAHPETLALLPKDLPVVASPTAAKRVRQMGFSQVTAIAPGQTTTVGSLEIRATKGAPVPQVENGYRLTDHASGFSCYYEPHGYVDPTVKDLGAVDVAITPIQDMALPLVGPIVQGRRTAPGLLRDLQPRYLLPTATGGDVIYSGILDRLLTVSGSAEELRAIAPATQILAPVAGRPLELV